jgi:hypothetical protein
MNKYNDSKIYKIVSSNYDKIYIGSTTKTLLQRLSAHRSDYKLFLNKKRKYCTSYCILEKENVSIELLEHVECSNIQELRQKERHYLDLYKEQCVNIVRPTITQDERKKYKQEWHQEHYLDKKALITQEEITAKKEYSREYHEKNKEKLKVKRKEYLQGENAECKKMITCTCGMQITKQCLNKHIQRAIHLQFIQK